MLVNASIARVKTLYEGARFGVGVLLFANGCTTLAPCHPPTFFGSPDSTVYVTEEVRISSDAGHVLVGTLTLPVNTEPPFPAVVLVTGSGAQNRDHVAAERAPTDRYRPFRQLADTLSRRGVAVLRMDDRGVGCSAGGPLHDTPIQQRADDTRATLAYLRARPDIDPGRHALLGLSEGANIAVLIAATDSSIKAIVTLGATATPGWDVYVSQQRQLAQHDIFTEEERIQLAAGVDVETVLVTRTESFRREVAQGKWGSWWPSFLAFNPRDFAPDVSCPVLIVHGSNDTNIPVEHASLLAETMRTAGNEDVTVRILRDHNHLLLEDTDGFFRHYGNLLHHTNQLSAYVLSLISDWLVERLSPTGSAAHGQRSRLQRAGNPVMRTISYRASTPASVRNAAQRRL